MLLLLTGTALLVVAALIVFFCGELYGLMSPALTMLLVPMSMGAALSLVWQTWAANNGDVKNLSLIRITQTLCITVLQIVAGWLQPTALVLAIAQVVRRWRGHGFRS